MMVKTKRIMFDLILVALLHVVGISMDWYSKPARRGFQCQDPSLSYEKQDNTITPFVVLTGSIFIPMATMILVDVISGRRGGWEIYHNIMVFEIGGLLVYVSNNILKYNLGLHRPYYISVCKPHYDEMCSPGTFGNPRCFGDENEVKWAGLTFPSLHSSVTAYGITYFMTFLYRYNKHQTSGYFVGILTAAAHVSCLTWSVFVGVSRVLDRRHHVIDVVCGGLWGFFIAVIVLLTIQRGVEQKSNSQVNEIICEETVQTAVKKKD